jgi:hypothetical protein
VFAAADLGSAAVDFSSPMGKILPLAWTKTEKRAVGDAVATLSLEQSATKS